MSRPDVTVFLCPAPWALPPEERLRAAAVRYAGEDARYWQIIRSAGGKPSFAGIPKVSFSISHSGDYWACAFGQAPVGLDIQRHEPCRREVLSKRFFHPEEARWLERCDYADFFRIWSAKESFLKYTGEGITGGLDWFSVLRPLPGNARLLTLSAPAGYSMCLCTPGPEEPAVGFVRL